LIWFWELQRNFITDYINDSVWNDFGEVHSCEIVLMLISMWEVIEKRQNRA
jgi:hypothetical protein